MTLHRYARLCIKDRTRVRSKASPAEGEPSWEEYGAAMDRSLVWSRRVVRLTAEVLVDGPWTAGGSAMLDYTVGRAQDSFDEAKAILEHLAPPWEWGPGSQLTLPELEPSDRDLFDSWTRRYLWFRAAGSGRYED